ncbi:MAG: prepilin-type N-terminal cleavage/methylation domain-containing protein [candidate division NC10 bacterium]|nr:prepilin-type N-terminal cleavage/methylation domain-containing protein [candidate division NC10 bacterium]
MRSPERRICRGRGEGQRKDHGFTLIEILIASTIFALVLLGIYVVYETNQATYTRGEGRADVQQNARVALDQMTRELLMAGYDPTRILANPGSYNNPTGVILTNYAMQSLGASSVRFLADVDGDNATEVVQFAYDGTNKQITRQVWVWNTATAAWTTSGAQAITEGNTINSLAFTYRDQNNAVTANSYEVRRIEISLSATVKVGSQGTQSFALDTDIRPRNL